jgi:hypothetical protein
MGCDIHGYIEYDNWTSHDGVVHRSCFGENLGSRDYKMFGLLAGVRRGSPIYPPRGLPENLSFDVKSAFHLFIIDDDGNDGEGFVTRKKAEEWVSQGYSKYLDDKYITYPDWHTPSWLTSKEYEDVLRAREEDTEYGTVDQEWYAILAAMKSLKNARFVFWFDN